MRLVPLGSVMLASALPMMAPVIVATTVLPSLGLLLYLAWLLLRPHLWPVWVGLPLGLWDDLVSGNAAGSGMALWTLAALVGDYADNRMFWRGFYENWSLAALMMTALVPASALLTQPQLPLAALVQLAGVQLLVGIGLFPLATRTAAGLDNWRLKSR